MKPNFRNKLDEKSQRRIEELADMIFDTRYSENGYQRADNALFELKSRGWLYDGSLEYMKFIGNEDKSLTVVRQNQNFSHSNLVRANFHSAKLHGIKLENSDLTGAYFENAILDRVSFKNSVLVDVRFGNTAFKDVDFSGVVGLETASHTEFSSISLENRN